ncbi:MAG: porin [Holosporales bacterium]|jgi:TolA-binding protein|nr:porin [Holosporales bacterium]
MKKNVLPAICVFALSIGCSGLLESDAAVPTKQAAAKKRRATKKVTKRNKETQIETVPAKKVQEQSASSKPQVEKVQEQSASNKPQVEKVQEQSASNKPQVEKVQDRGSFQNSTPVNTIFGGKDEGKKTILANENSAKKKKEADKKDGESAVPILKISGKLGVIYSFSNPNYTYYGGDENGRGKSQKKAVQDVSGGRVATNSAEVAFAASGRLANKWKYEAKLSMDAYKESIAIDKAYVTLERDNVGSFSAGNHKGPEATMLSGGQELFGGADGLDGAASSDVDAAPGVLRMINLVGYSSKASKLVYFTPILGGFQFGLSYTPDTRHHGKRGKAEGTARGNGNDDGIVVGDTTNNTDKPYGEHNMGYGVSQEFKIAEGVSGKIAITYIHEKTRDLGANPCYDETGTKVDGADLEAVKLNNVNGYHATATFTIKNFSFGCGYLDNGKSRLPIREMYRDGREKYSIGKFVSDVDGNSGKSWNVGMKYRITSKLVLSAVYHQTSRKVTGSEEAKGHMTSLALDYVVCSGLKFFVEANHLYTETGKRACLISSTIDTKLPGNIFKQKTMVFLTGAKITF